MKYLIILIISLHTLFGDEVSKKYIAYLQHPPAKTKKHRFLKLVLPLVQQEDKRLRALYKRTLDHITNNTHQKEIRSLMRSYRTHDPVDLLKRIKPHPISITLAQAALESAWGTSRFFVEAHNIFGVWSKKVDKEHTIAASQVRKNGHQVHLVKYDSLAQSIRAYYKNIATNKAYIRFRDARFISDDPYYIVTFLDEYSELGEIYPIHLIKVIHSNNFTKYDYKEQKEKKVLQTTSQNPKDE